MRPFAVLSAFIFALPLAGLAQTQPAPPASDSLKNEAVVFERSETTWRMHADGTGERDVHVRIRIQSIGAAQQFGVVEIAYASATETPVIKYVRVHKPDGSTVETPASDAVDMSASVTREAPLYSDLKEKHLPVRSLSSGDILDYEVDTTIDKPEAPGQFWGAYHFTAPGSIVVLEEILTLEAPADKYIQVWSPNHKPVTTEHNGLRTWTWNVPQLVTAPQRNADDASKPTPPKDPDEDSDGRKLPSVAWTTFRSWTEVGDWYRSLALAEAQPTDAIRTRADDLTKNAKMPDDQIRALYDFVSGHTRYIGIDFGIGRYQPHAAAAVAANQYGDCKDKDTLLEALLRAKGFSTAPALIGAGIAPVPELPSPAVFNHVITTVNLPSGRIWLDSTPEAAPYQYLSAVIRDQKALIVPPDAPAMLVSTPAVAPYPFSAHFEADSTLDAEGKLTGKVNISYRDDDEVLVRAIARSVAPAQWDNASQYISSTAGFSGATSDTHFSNADSTTSPIGIAYSYTKHPYGDWDNNRILPLLPATDLAVLDTDNPDPQEDIQLGAPRTLVAISRIRLPDGYHTDPPDPIHVKTAFATFDKTYRFDGSQLVVERTITVLSSKIAKADWKQYQSFTKDISLDSEAWIQLIPPSKAHAVIPDPNRPKLNAKPGSPSAPSTPAKDALPAIAKTPDAAIPDSPGNPSVTDLMQTADDRLHAGDIEGAKEALDKVKAKNPNQENLWAAYGFIAGMERNLDDAKADFRKELAAHPDNARVVIALASEEAETSDTVGARQTLQHYLDRHPENLQLSLYLAGLQTNAQDYASALKTLETAAEQNPDDKIVRLQESEALRRLHRNDEAAAAARSVLDGADDPEILNDGAYALGETGVDLPLAEEYSRKSIATLEEKSASISTAEVNSKSFAEANLLIASWDTLGWILYREEKLTDAQPLISAAWRASLHAEVGDHLAQIDEAQGKKDDAATTYALAAAAIDRNVAPDVRVHINESIARLKAAGAKPGPAGAIALQEMRTYKIEKPTGVSGWGTFRLEITTAGVIESQQMSGEKGIAGIKASVDKMKFPELLPPDSKAHLLRSGVVSCSAGPTCEVVLVPDGGIQTEQQ